MRRLAWLSCSSLALAACGTHGVRPSAPSAAADAKVVQVWEYPASEFPAMCMVMQADGSVQFRGGFKFFNPGTWRTGSKPDHLVLSLGGSAPFPTASANQALKLRPASLLHFDAGRRELEFLVNAAPMSFISFGGFYFYKTERCSVGP